MTEQRDQPAEDTRDGEEAAREDRDTGGDAQAAASLEDREAVARGDDDLFEDDDEDG